MKIKTITCHNVYNVGASLQAYALIEYLNSLGHEVEIIDYVPDYLNHYPIWGCVSDRYNKPVLKTLYCLAKYPGRSRELKSERKRNFDAFTDKYLPLTAKHYKANEELYADTPKADVIFAGSDQIWNSLFKNGRDSAFYLDFAKQNTVKASYAASFAIEEVPEDVRNKVKAWLDNMDFISVRESSGVRILRELGIQGGCRVVDPVFLETKEFWEDKCTDVHDAKPYVFVYDFDRNSEIEKMAKAEAARLNASIYSYQELQYADKTFWNADPMEFVSLIKNAECVISNSFHGTAFALIFNKPFWVFGRQESINTRMIDLVQDLGISDRLLKNADDAGPADINYAQVNSRLNEMVANSKDYINKVLEETEKRYAK